MFTVRKVIPDDRDRILEISADIWEGNDYIPFIFDKWVADNKGEFSAVLYNNRIVGFGRLIFITPNDVWLEGLRADQRIKIKGIGTVLSKYYLNKLKEYDNLVSIRLATYYSNIASITLTERLGFKLKFKMSNKHYSLLDQDNSKGINYAQFKPVLSMQEIDDYLKKSEFLIKSHNCISIAWVCYPYTIDFVMEMFINSGRYFAYKQNGLLKGLLLYDLDHAVNSYSSSTISFLEADNEMIASKLVDAHKKIVSENRLQEIEIKVPNDSMTWNYLNQTGFYSWEREEDFFVYEYPMGELKL